MPESQVRLALQSVDLGQREVGAEQARLQPDRLLEQSGALVEPLLLEPDGAENGTGDGPRLGIGERQPRLLLSFLEPSLLDQHAPPSGAPRGRRLARPSLEHRLDAGANRHCATAVGTSTSAQTSSAPDDRTRCADAACALPSAGSTGQLP